jgi:hypothetical protein
MRMSYEWAMPSGDTLSIKPIREFAERWMAACPGAWADPYARNSRMAAFTNDLDPNTAAACHLSAEDFLRRFEDGLLDGVLFDPPYSSRQAKELYESIGLKYTYEESIGESVRAAKVEVARTVRLGGIVLSFGWNSVGMGRSAGFEKEEILLVGHGGAHNDTICVAERKIERDLFLGVDTISETW